MVINAKEFGVVVVIGVIQEFQVPPRMRLLCCGHGFLSFLTDKFSSHSQCNPYGSLIILLIFVLLAASTLFFGRRTRIEQKIDEFPLAFPIQNAIDPCISIVSILVVVRRHGGAKVIPSSWFILKSLGVSSRDKFPIHKATANGRL